MVALKISFSIKNTRREKTCLNETPALSNSMNMDIWAVGTSDQILYVRGSSTVIKVSKK